MNAPITIALDAMGGDHGPDVVLPASLDMLKRNPELHLILVGDEQVVRDALQRAGGWPDQRLHIHHASQCVEMDEIPSQALRGKKDSSMRVAIDLVKAGRAQACVSAGNTGALMATARFVLKTLPGIDRPAIISSIPSVKGPTWVLDLGANVDCSAQHLLQFAVMGSVLVTAVDGVKSPRVGLLNIGAEEMKGNEQVKKAAMELSRSSLNYIGYVEGDDVYLGDVDVVVCDGFVGNVALKTSEGVAKMIRHFLREEFSRSLISRLRALIAAPVLKAFGNRIDPRLYNGATLLGLRGIVIKSHGGADAMAFANAIKVAMIEARKGVPDLIHHRLDEFLNDRRVG